MSANDQISDEHTSAWKPLIDDWISRERRLRPDAQVRPDSVRVRDAVEIDDLAYVLLSYDVDHPWPAEEDMTGDQRSAQTAVLQARRVRQPWIERDNARSLSRYITPDGSVVVHEHLLGPRRALSGVVITPATTITLGFEGGDTASVDVVDGWFLFVTADSHRIETVTIVPEKTTDDAESQILIRDDVDDAPMLEHPAFFRTAGNSMYFSPLDLRKIHPLVCWERAGDVVIVAAAIEQYDEGGILRLRIDGIRRDDDAFVSWPTVTIKTQVGQFSSAICGEYGNADTATIDVGFKPYLDTSVETLTVQIEGLRGAQGPVAPISLDIDVRKIV